ncbi:hypothetical protein A2U01_0092055, partial [Trifolium medium]|nr:hypothetical protein [Trifolium medium]
MEADPRVDGSKQLVNMNCDGRVRMIKSDPR